MTRRQRGIFEILASGFCFGFLGLLGKSAFEKGLTPGEFLALRYLLAAAMLAVLVVVQRLVKRTKLFPAIRSLWPGPRVALLSLSLGVLGYAVFSSFYFMALARISASMTVILLYLYPVLVSLGGLVFFAERVPLARLPALPLAFVGLALLVWNDVSIGQPEGLVFGVLAALFYSIYILLSSHWLKANDPFVSTVWIQLGAGVVLAVLHLRSFDVALVKFATASIDVILIAFVCSVLAMSLFLSGLLKVKNWEASLLSMAEPITGVAIGVLVLGEVLSILQWAGAILVLLALSLVSIPERKFFAGGGTGG